MNTRKAPKGKWLTQATLDSEDNRIFVKEVSGFGDLDALFTLYTDSQKAEWEEQHPEQPNE